MTVDFHAHLAREEPDAPAFLRNLFDVSGYLEAQEAARIERTVLSYGLSEGRGGRSELDEARRQHEFLAGLVERYPDRLSALAGIDPFGGRDWLVEAERALDAGFAGLCFPTSLRGKYLDSPTAADAFSLANERGALVFIHPSASPVGTDRAGDPFLTMWIGRPLDVGLCLSRMIVADTLAGYPAVRAVAAQAGGVLPVLVGRLEHVLVDFTQRPPEWGGPPGGRFPEGHPMANGGRRPPTGGAAKVVMRLALKLGLRPPGMPRGGDAALAQTPKEPLQAAFGPGIDERVRRFYYDTSTLHPASIRAAVDAFGIDRIVLGTDFPPVGDSPAETIALIDAAGLTQEQKDSILAGNAPEVLGGIPAPAS